jgi:hypothetical protein
VVEAGIKSSDVLRRCLQRYLLMSREDRAEVDQLLKRVFDPTGTLFAGESLVYRWACGSWASFSLTHNGCEP